MNELGIGIAIGVLVMGVLDRTLLPEIAAHFARQARAVRLRTDGR